MAQKQIKQLNQATEVLEDDLFVIQQSADDDTLRIKKSDVFAGGWNPLNGAYTTATGYNAGNRSFTIDTSIDITSIVSPGMRFKVNRDTVPPTECADLEASSSQYASKSSPTGLAQTDNITVEAQVKPESYGVQYIATKSTTPGANGWRVYLNSSGQILINGQGRYSNTYASLPLGKWSHIAVSIDMSANSVVFYVDGVIAPSTALNGSGASWTDSGNFFLGSDPSGANTFDGKLADVRVWSDVRTATEIQDNMFAYPADTTGLVAHFKLDGDFTDSSTNDNDLTAFNSATATDTDNPWNATEYGIITAVSATDMQVFCPQGYGIPLETLTAPFYSTQSAPFGFPTDKGLWVVESLYRESYTGLPIAAVNQWANSTLHNITVPIGAWKLIHDGQYLQRSTGARAIEANFTLHNAVYLPVTNGNYSHPLSSRMYSVSSSTVMLGPVYKTVDIVIPTAAVFNPGVQIPTASGTETWEVVAARAGFSFRAECAYI